MKYQGIKYNYDDLEKIPKEVLKEMLKWAKEEMENGNDIRA